MPRKLVFLSCVLLAILAMPSAMAAKPIREINPNQGDVVIRGQCAFPVLGHIEGREIITTFTDRTGEPVKQIVIFPGNMLTLTNPLSDASITVMGTGSSQLRAGSDGSTTARAMGHGVFFPNPLTGEPGIWYLSGQGTAIIDQSGDVTSKLAGRLVDLCSQLE